MTYQHIYELFHDRVEHYRGRDAFYVRAGEGWRGITWDRFDDEAHSFASALIASGHTHGSSVCILMGSVPEWPISDLGTIIAGGVSVGLYPTSSAEQCEYITNHADAEFVLVDTASQLEKIRSVTDRLPKVKTVIALDEDAVRDHPKSISYGQFLELGKRHLATSREVIDRRLQDARAEDTAIIVYTSGTTGPPKGACLSHQYVLGSVESLRRTIPFDDSDVSFSYLPFCHVAERISGLYNRLYAGASAYFVDDLTKLWDYMLEVKPTVFASLPRFFEKIHARIMSDMETASHEVRDRFDEAMSIGRELSGLRQERKSVPDHLNARYLAQASPVIEKVKSYFGGRIRLATSGGAPLPNEIAEFFDAAGVPILQAYGLTEYLCVAFNRPDCYKFGTVGPAMPGCELKIASDGEILVRGRTMFSGYYKEPEKTAEVMRDGWLLTGDLGELDSDGFLKIIGRKKELIITSSGKNIAPSLIENMLKEHQLISHAMAYGEGKNYLVALITLNTVETEAYAHLRGIAHEGFADLTQKTEINDAVVSIVSAVNARVSSPEAIKKFVILDHDLSVEANEVTPTMKIKRSIVSERYRDALEGLYH